MSNNSITKAVYVGDTIKDLESANVENIPFVYTKYGFGKNIKTEYYINDITELPGIINQIGDSK